MYLQTQPRLYNYFSNGLQINSEIEFPELSPSNGRSNIFIRKGKVSERLDNMTSEGETYQVSNDKFLLDIENVARYLVNNWNEIIIDCYPDADPTAVRLFILSTLFSVVIYQQDRLVMHASSINYSHDAIIMAGDSGVGKSTLALRLHLSGYDILNDDISTVYFENDKPKVYKGCTNVRLWSDSLMDLGHNLQEYKRIRPELEKYIYPIKSDHIAENYDLKAVFIICVENITTIQKRKLHGAELFENLRVNTFSEKLVKELNKSASQFQLCSQLANKIPVFKISRPLKIDHNTYVNYMIEAFRAV